MKIEHSGSEVISSSQNQTHKFGVNQGAQMFKVLSNTLYSDKVRAIIRELSCNAWDAHVAADKPDVPFEIHMPTAHEPWFAIKDQGTGLSHDDILALFCTYFGSNKTTSDKFIGALGLGSKSPFCYTPMYNVKVTHEGVTRMYEARVDENGEPTLQQMGHDMETPQLGNGIEIKFSVKQGDIWEFANKAKLALEFFDPRPITNIDLNIQKTDYIVRGKSWGMRNGMGIRAIMGNVQYAVGHIDISRLNKRTAKIIELPLDIYFNIGDLSFTASREALELDEKTVKSITDAYEMVYNEMIDAVKAKIDACENEWQARILIFSLTNTTGVGKFVRDAWDNDLLFGRYKNFTLSGKWLMLDTFNNRHTVVQRFHHNSKAQVNAKKEVVIFDTHHFAVDNDIHFVINDLEKHGEKYVHYFLQQANDRATHKKKHVYLFSRFDKETPIDFMVAEAKKMMHLLGNPTFELASELKARYSTFVEAAREHRNRARSGVRNIVELKSDFCRYRYEDGWGKAWDKASEPIPDGVKYYIPLERLRGKESGFDTAFQFLRFVQNVRGSGAFGLDAETPVYGLRKKSKLRNKKEWVELTNHVMNTIKATMTPTRELQLSLTLCPFTEGDNYEDVFKHAADWGVLSPDSPFQKFAKALAFARYRSNPDADEKFKSVLDEAEKRGYYKKGRVLDFNTEWKKTIKQYPLLTMVDSFTWDGRRDAAKLRTAILEYVAMQDEMRIQREKAAVAERLREEMTMAAAAGAENEMEEVL